MAPPRHILGLDIGSNSVGSMWLDAKTGAIRTGTSIFPAGVDEADDKRGDPKNAKRRMTRRTRITLRRRAERKRALRLKLIECGLLPAVAVCDSCKQGTQAKGSCCFKGLLEANDPWMLRKDGLDRVLTPYEFGRVLLHLAQRRGALGLHIDEPEEGEEADAGEDGKVKEAIGAVRAKMIAAKVRTFGEFIAIERAKRVTPLTSTDLRPPTKRAGQREYRDAIRNKAGSYEHCADRGMIRDEFDKLWKAQKARGSATARLLTDALRMALDDESGDSIWRHRGLLFGQRRQTWDLGTLGRCVLEPTERCAPHADMYASRYRVVETVNILRIIERGIPRPLEPHERRRIKDYLSGPLGMQTKGKAKGKPKEKVSPSDLRVKMAEWYGATNWPKSKKLSPCRFVNEDSDENRDINTDWFSREIIHGAIGLSAWATMSDSLKDGINRAILKHDPDQDGDADTLKSGVMKWAKLSEAQADALVAAWKARPPLDAKRLNMSRRAVRNLLTVMDRNEPWPDPQSSTGFRWAEKNWSARCIAEDAEFRDASTARTFEEEAEIQRKQGCQKEGKPYDAAARQQAAQAAAIRRRRYMTGAKGATAADRHYMGKHKLTKNGKLVLGADGQPLAEPPPAPLISNPVVRKTIHEVRRHLIEYMTTFGRKPDEVHIELAREARMGAKDADRLLFKNRLRNRIRNDIIEDSQLTTSTPTQQRAAVDRVVLCVQQGGVCPLCGRAGLTTRNAARGTDCELAHIMPRAKGGHNGLNNLVLAHLKCNRDMARRTPREFWNATLKGGFDEGFRWIEGLYGQVERPKPSEVKNAKGDPLWACYFDGREDKRKIEQFAKDVKDIQEMTGRQEAATKYATRQVMAYLADAIFDGHGLPERATGSGNPEDQRRIFATDGMWTGRLRREWGLFFDPHNRKAKGLSNEEEHQRKEKDRGDHRHHAIDAVVIGFCTASVQNAWKKREDAAEAERDKDGKPRWNTADEEQMDKYRRLRPLDPPAPYKTREEFREAVRLAVFGDEKNPRPICHRPVKRKLIGALHEETLFGPVLDSAGKPTGNFTAKKSVLSLTPNHLRMPEGWDDLESKYHDGRTSPIRKRAILRELAAMDDPPPAKSGIVRDRALRNQLRKCLRVAKLDPDRFTANEIKRLVESGGFKHASGVPIRSVVLLRTMSDPVVFDRKQADYVTGKIMPDPNPASRRAYVGGNNHHIEIREKQTKQGKVVWSGVVISTGKTAKRKQDRLRAFRAAGVPKPAAFRDRDKHGQPTMTKAERSRWRPVIAAIEKAHPLVNRADDDALGGRFVMSLCEGETVFCRRWQPKSGQISGRPVGDPAYWVVAKVSESEGIVFVAHWDARRAKGMKGVDGSVKDGSKREDWTVSPSDLRQCGSAPDQTVRKVRVSPLGVITELERD